MASVGKGAPPPPPKGKGKGPKGPPPPTLPKAASVAAPEAHSGPRLRPLFWSSVSALTADTLWEDLTPAASFDQALLEKHFALAESRTPTPSERRTLTDKVEPRKRVRVLDDRTSQKLAIAFNRLPPPERLAKLVDAFEEFPEGMPSEAVLALSTAVSEQKQAIDQLRQLGVDGPDVSQLDMPERYLWVLCAVPSLAEKLSCGALIVGPARELGELRYAGMAVGTCCRALRESKVLRKCISTCLAIGNHVNRGTARSGARAIILPDSLLKLEELRGAAQDGVDSPRGASARALSLLDFVAQSLVDEVRRSNAGDIDIDLRAEVEDLWGKVKAAQSVSLDDAERSATQICGLADQCYKSLTTMKLTAGVRRIADRIREIHDEAHTAKTLLMAGKMELAKTQKWSSAKGGVKPDEWLGGWSAFLEQLAASFARARGISNAVVASRGLQPRNPSPQDRDSPPSATEAPSGAVLAASDLFRPQSNRAAVPPDACAKPALGHVGNLTSAPTAANKANADSIAAGVSKPKYTLFPTAAATLDKENRL